VARVTAHLPLPVRVHVAATGNAFMRDIAGWLVEAAGIAGRSAALVDDALPVGDGSTIDLVVAPHEFFELFDAPRSDLQRAAAASIAVCTEQPGTPWFHLTVDACRRGLTSLDINAHGVAALRDLGLDAHHLPLGAVPSMRADVDGGDRPIDVLFMGGLYRRRTELRLFRFDRPVGPGTPGVVFGDDKYRLLASAKVLLNLHRDRSIHLPAGVEAPPYFEWARMIETMANGCVVLTEPSELHDPLVPGVHFVEADVNAGVDEMADALDALLDDPGALTRMADAARSTVTGPLALAGALGPVLDRLERDVVARIPAHVATSQPTKGLWRLGASKVTPPVRLGPFRPYLTLQRDAKRLALAENRALQRLDGLACLLHHGETQHIERIATPAYAGAQPEVSVIVTVYNYADVVTETLDSIAASGDIGYELIVVDDHATDTSRAVVRDWLSGHPTVPAVLLGKDANEGLAAARNDGFAAARAPYVMVMDADNHVYPTCLRRLADALDVDLDASAVYAVLEDFGASRNVRSAIAWDVPRLCAANYIDAQAMWRRSAWAALGGYRADDDHVYGWEDWDLWLRLAESGGHAQLVPQILGRYRVQQGSMIALTNLATDEAITAVRHRYPSLPWP
jgi:hypothetical protein